MKIIYILQLVFNLNFLLFFCQFANATESSLFETQFSSQLSISQLEKFRYFLIDIEKSLPEHIKNIIKQPVRVKFTNADLDLDSLLSCRNNINTQVATLDLLDIQKKEFEITLSSKLLDILKDENSKNQMSCRHKTAIRFFKAIILHEIAHIIDYNGDFNELELLDRKNCEELDSNEQIRFRGLTIYDSCYEALKARGRISENRTYKRLSGFIDKSEFHDLNTSLDPYENTSLREHFAVNFEYYILDREYSCSRPRIFDFFNVILREIRPSCFNTLQLVDEKSRQVISVDPKKIFQIDYFHVTKGLPLMSRWGHSMFRLIVCSPERKKVDEDCRKDTSYHILIGFGAQTQESGFSNFKGVFGIYPTKLSTLQFESTTYEYVSQEFRTIYSIPLLFTEKEKIDFLKNVIQLSREYRGKYKFLTNNCSGEAFRLVRMSLESDHLIQGSYVYKPHTPSQFLRILSESGLVDLNKSNANEYNIKHSYYIPSSQSYLEAQVKNILQKYGMKLNLSSYTDLKAKNRMVILEKLTETRDRALMLRIENSVAVTLQNQFLVRAENYAKKFDPNLKASTHQEKNQLYYEKIFQIYSQVDTKGFNELMLIKTNIQFLKIQIANLK